MLISHVSCPPCVQVRLWDVTKCRELGRLSFMGHSHPVRSLASSSDGNLLVSGGDDHKVRAPTGCHPLRCDSRRLVEQTCPGAYYSAGFCHMLHEGLEKFRALDDQAHGGLVNEVYLYLE